MSEIKRNVVKLNPRAKADIKEVFLIIVDDRWLDKVAMFKKTAVKNNVPNLRNLLALCDLEDLEFNCDFGAKPDPVLEIKYFSKEKEDYIQEKKLDQLREEKQKNNKDDGDDDKDDGNPF